MVALKRYSMLCGVVLTLATTAQAQEPAEDDDDEGGLPEWIQEFGIGESVFVQEKGETQITVGTESAKNEDEREREAFLKVEYGITDRLQVEVEAPYEWLRPTGGTRERGLGDMGLGLLYQLRRGGEGRTAVSLGLELGLATGNESKDLGEGRTTFSPTVVFGRAVGRGQVHLSLGGETGNGAPEYGASLAAVYPASRKLFPTIELNAFRFSDEGNRIYVTPGAVYRISEATEFGLSIPLGISSRGVRLGPIAKFTVEF